MFIKALVIFFITLLFCLSGQAGGLTAEQQAAKVKGITLYNQHKAISAVPYLEIAAKAGDRDAQYYLGEALRFNNRYMTEDAYKWYVAAADQGDYYAMYRLSGSENDLCSIMSNCPVDTKTPGDWLLQGRGEAKSKADKGDIEAMYVLTYLTNKDEWLEKAADAGFPQAQYDLALMYEEGRKFYFPPWDKSEKVEELLRKSAEGGFPKGMMMLFRVVYDKGNVKEAQYWAEKAAETGFVSGVLGYGMYSAHEPDLIKLPLNLVKGYGLVSLLLELDGGGAKDDAEYILPKIAAKMTPEQIEEAKAYAKEWKATHPPLSFFPDKLGF
ncbi:sel1 repeat family protein [Ectopseudomonas mendocina]|uniref:Sel1 repeat family protein n=1 Tax=Ectopseudomonas mendocina TaxID=300 RepID=A0ABZ2REH1_ECTME